jgi:hypothetical protein
MNEDKFKESVPVITVTYRLLVQLPGRPLALNNGKLSNPRSSTY